MIDEFRQSFFLFVFFSSANLSNTENNSMQRRSVPRTDPRYNQIRAKNNDSVKKSREKSRRERDETISAIQQLEDENENLNEQIQFLKDEFQQLQNLFHQHTGINIDEFLSNRNSSSTNVEPEPKPVLTINTEDKSAESSTSNVELNPTDLEGAIVLINGVQYRIFSVNKSSSS